jgi:hypothetical protein
MRIAQVALLLSAIGGAAAAETVTLEWNDVSDDRVTMYVLAWGTWPRPDGVMVDHYKKGSLKVPVGTTEATTPDLPAADGPTGLWYFAVQACDDGGVCSDWSNEIAVDIAPAIEIPAGLRLKSIMLVPE